MLLQVSFIAIKLGGATVKLWDEGLRDLSDKVKGMQPRSPPPGGDDTGAHPRLAPEGDDTGAPARPARLPP